MSAFSLLKNLCMNKPCCAFKDLPQGEYLIYDFALVRTKFGVQLRLDLGDKVVFLPERFSKHLKPEDIPELNKPQKILCYNGMDASKKNAIKIDFKTVEEFTMDINANEFYH